MGRRLNWRIGSCRTNGIFNRFDAAAGSCPAAALTNNGGSMQELAGVGRLSRRVAGLRPSGIRKFFDIAATMKDVISLGIGEPDFTTPKPILDAGLRSLQRGETHYTSNHGKLELRRALSANLKRLYGVEYDPLEEMVITVGVSEALYL